MIAKDRNRAIVQLICALVLTVTQLFYFGNKRLHTMSQDEIALIFFGYLGTVGLWILGSYNLAKAKGYDGHTIGGVFIFLFIAGSCVPMAPLLYPAVVLFGLPDKTRQRRRRSRHNSE